MLPLIPPCSSTSLLQCLFRSTDYEMNEAWYEKFRLPAEAPIAAGRIVYVQVLPRETVEGIDLQLPGAPGWHDPSLSSTQCPTSAKPAIVLSVTKDESARKRHSAKVLILTRIHDPLDQRRNILFKLSATSGGKGVLRVPYWPMPDIYCYAYPRVVEITFLPTEVCLMFYSLNCYFDHFDVQNTTWTSSCQWTVSSGDLTALSQYYESPNSLFNVPGNDKINWNRMKEFNKVKENPFLKVYGRFTAITQSNIQSRSLDNGVTVEWENTRGFFDDFLSVSLKRCAAWEMDWAHISAGTASEAAQRRINEAVDKYDDPDWNSRIGAERDADLTLSTSQKTLLTRLSPSLLGHIAGVALTQPSS